MSTFIYRSHHPHSTSRWSKRPQMGRSIFYPHPPPPPRMAGFRPLKVLVAPFEGKNPKGSFFGGTFEKNFRRVNFLAAPLI